MAFTYKVNISEDTSQNGRQFIKSLVETIEKSDLYVPTTAEEPDVFLAAIETMQLFPMNSKMFSIVWHNWFSDTIENHFDIACYPYGHVIFYPDEQNTLFGMHQAEIMCLNEDGQWANEEPPISKGFFATAKRNHPHSNASELGVSVGLAQRDVLIAEEYWQAQKEDENHGDD